MSAPNGMRADNTSAPLRAAIVGSGLMGRWHADAVARIGAQVIAVADPNLEAARQLAAKHRGAQAFSTLEAMLAQVRPDVVHICTPLPTHQSLAESAIEAGCHLLVEKPLTEDVRDTELLLESAARRGVLICPVHQFTFQDGVSQARRRLPQLGRLIHLQATFSSAGGAHLDSQATCGTLTRSSALDAIIADILPHPLSLLQAFLPDGAPCDGWTTTHPADGELRAHCTSNESTISLFISMNARPTESSFQLVGTKGTIHLDLFHGYAWRQSGQVSRARKIIQPFDGSLRHLWAAGANLTGRMARVEPAYPGLRRLVAAFYRAVERGKAAPISSGKILQAARVRERLMRQMGLPGEDGEARL